MKQGTQRWNGTWNEMEHGNKELDLELRPNQFVHNFKQQILMRSWPDSYPLVMNKQKAGPKDS